MDTKTELGAIKELKEEYLEPFMHLMMQYECAMLEVQTKLEVLNKELALVNSRNPFESIKARLKSPESIYGKMQRKGIPFSIENIEKNLTDIAGIRVICSFPEDIYKLVECLLKQDDVTLVKEKDYIVNPKPNGYRSLHLIVEVPIFLKETKKPMRVEIQLRTIAMDFWASIEHKLKYKKNVKDAERLTSELKECADTLMSLDLKMQDIRRVIEEGK